MEKKAVGFEIRSLNNHIKRYIILTRPPELDEFTMVHGWAMRFFYENLDRDIFQKDFENHFSIRRSTATKMLQLMEKNGLINRVSVENDARLKKIVLTEKAVEIHRKITADIMEREKRLAMGISKEELDTFFKVANQIRTNLEDNND